MIRLILFFVLIAVLITAFSWVAERPGDLTLNWMDYEIKLSLLTALIGLLALIFILFFIIGFIRTVFRSPHMIKGYFAGRKRDKGYEALSKGMIAIGAGDVKTAQRSARIATKNLENAPLVTLLKAQLAQLNGHSDKARALFQQMSEEDETRLLGLHGLYLEAIKEGDQEAAHLALKDAANASPTLDWANQNLVEDYAKRKEWVKALNAVERNYRYKLLNKESYKRLSAILKTAYAYRLRDESPEEALGFALNAHHLAPDLVPAATLAGALLGQQTSYKKASKVLETCWKLNSHPELADIYIALRSGEAVQDRLKRAQNLKKLDKHSLEGSLTLACYALEAKMYDVSREALAPWIEEGQATKRVCLLMAKLEEAEENTKGAVRYWYNRALRASADPTWIADGMICPQWVPVSPISGALDQCEWKIPPQEDLNDYLPALDLPAQSDKRGESEHEILIDGNSSKIIEDDAEIEAQEKAQETPLQEPSKKGDIARQKDEENDIFEEQIKDSNRDKKDKNTIETEANKEESSFPLPSRPDDPGPKDKNKQSNDTPFRVF